MDGKREMRKATVSRSLASFGKTRSQEEMAEKTEKDQSCSLSISRLPTLPINTLLSDMMLVLNSCLSNLFKDKQTLTCYSRDQLEL